MSFDITANQNNTSDTIEAARLGLTFQESETNRSVARMDFKTAFEAVM